MKNIVYGESTWLIGDAAADALLDYAVFMAQTGSADHVDAVVLGPDGDEVVTSMVLGPATMITAQTMSSAFEEPDNSALMEYVRVRLERPSIQAQAATDDISLSAEFGDL